MQSAGLEFRTAQAKPPGKDASHQLFLLAGGVACAALEIKPGVWAFNRPGAHCKAELDVCFDFPGMSCPIEQSKLNGSFSEKCMEVYASVPACIVVLMVDASAVAVICLAVPDTFHTAFAFFGIVFHCFQQVRIHFPAPVIGTVADFQRFIEKVLPADCKVHQTGQTFRRVVLPVHMNMDSAGIVCYRSSSPEGSYNILKILYIFILEDRACLLYTSDAADD